MLHQIYQRHGMTPDEFYAKPKWVQTFIMASIRVTVEGEGEISGNS